MAFNETKAFKNFMAKLYGLGAAIVIIGAMFKIMHWPGAGPMLVVGLSTEAVIFIFSAFDKPHEEPDWSLVYPELAMGEDIEHGHGGSSKKIEKKKEGDLVQELDKMLEQAKIGPELIQSLGDGMRNLSENANKLSGVTDAAAATGDYVNNLNNAATSVSKLTSVYEETAEALKKDVSAAEVYSESITKAASSAMTLSENYTQAAESTKQLTEVAKNLEALNAAYQAKIQQVSEQTNSSERLNAGIEAFIANLQNSTNDTKQFNEGVAQLAKNIAALNSIYGNMLSAMNKPM